MEKEHFTTSLEHIQAELERIDLLIRAQVMRSMSLCRIDDENHGFDTSEQRVDKSTDTQFGPQEYPLETGLRSQADIRAAIDHMSGDIWLNVVGSRQRGIRLRLDEIVTHFDLTSGERDIFLICLAPEFDLLYERIFGYLQNDVAKIRPSVGLVSNILSTCCVKKSDVRRYFAADAPLFEYALLQFLDDFSSPHLPLRRRHLQVDERIVNHLLGVDHMDSYVMPDVRKIDNKTASGFDMALRLLWREALLQHTAFYRQGIEPLPTSYKHDCISASY